MCHVLRRGVIKPRGHHQLLLRRLGITLLTRENGDALQCGLARQPIRHALRNPVVYDLIKRRAHLEPPAALVLDGERRFFEQQTFRRERREYTPPALILHDLPEVSRRVERKNRKRKTVLPLRLRMTTPPCAPGPA